ncbi:MAG: hypothetical protein HS111_33600 [Kofleriaceae bacterium]|nr:hypothetical protein [Kofleriaceae bacterium]
MRMFLRAGRGDGGNLAARLFEAAQRFGVESSILPLDVQPAARSLSYDPETVIVAMASSLQLRGAAPPSYHRTREGSAD